MASWQYDAASSYHTRQRYREGLVHQGRDEAMQEMILGTFKIAFMSDDPKMVDLRRQIFLQGHQATVQADMATGTSQLQRYQVDKTMEKTLGRLQVPVSRRGMKKDVAQGLVQPPDPQASYDG